MRFERKKFQLPKLSHVPKIGASYEELGSKSASEQRTYFNTEFAKQLKREEFASYAKISLTLIAPEERPLETYSPESSHPLFAIMDEALEKQMKSGVVEKSVEVPRAHGSMKGKDLFDIMDEALKKQRKEISAKPQGKKSGRKGKKK